MKDYPDSFKYNHLIFSVKKTISTFSMIQKGDSVLVGVSGGPDSVALVHILHFLAPYLSFTLGIAHLNHCLRGKDSDNDAKFVLSMCENLNVRCFTAKENVLAYKKQHGLSLEEASRRVRYGFYYKTAKTNGFNKIALGHHQDDNAELILMHLFRGSGPLGISGIPPIRKYQENDINIIRPFIESSKTKILGFLKLNNFQYVTDKSNQDPSHLRNKIRNDLLPVLKETYNPKIIETLNRVSSIIRSEERWMNDSIQPLFEKLSSRQGNGGIILSVSELNELPVAPKRRIIRKAIAQIKGNIRRITLTHIDLIIAFSNDGSSQGSLDLPDRIRIVKENNDLLIVQENKHLRDIRPQEIETAPGPYKYTICGPWKDVEPGDTCAGTKKTFLNKEIESIFINEINAHLRFTKIRLQDISNVKIAEHKSAFFDYEKLRFPLVLRNIEHGDRFTPLGMTGSQKVKKYFINQKIPKYMRADIPVLVSNGKIIWVVGHRIDDAYKVISTTRNVLKAEFSLA